MLSADWLRKPELTDCEHADPGGVGCKVYDARGWDCAGSFACSWARGYLDARTMKPEIIGGFVVGLLEDEVPRIHVREGARVPQELLDAVFAVAGEREVHVHQGKTVTAYRKGLEVVPIKPAQDIGLGPEVVVPRGG